MMWCAAALLLIGSTLGTRVSAQTPQPVPLVAPPADSIGALRAEITRLASSGRWQEALPIAQRVLLVQPDDVSLLTDAGQWLVWSGRAVEGIPLLRRAVALAPGSIEPARVLGQVLTWNGATSAEGVAILRQVLVTHPSDAGTRRALGSVLTWRGETRGEGIRLLRGVFAEFPKDHALQVELADVLSWDVRTRGEAEALYDAVRLASPLELRASRGLLNIYAWTGRPRRAFLLADSLLAQAPTDTAVMRARLAALVTLRRYADAISDANSWLQHAPADVETRVQLATALLAQGRSRSAREALSLLPPGASPPIWMRDNLRRENGTLVSTDVSSLATNLGLRTSRATLQVSAPLIDRVRGTLVVRPAWYDASPGGFRSQMVGAALDFRLGVITARANAGLERFASAPTATEGGLEFVGTAGVRRRDVEWRIGVRRLGVEDSPRAARGADLAEGGLIGQVRANTGWVRFRAPSLPLGLDLNFGAGSGLYTGRALRNNSRRDLDVGLSRSIQMGVPRLDLGIGWSHLAFAFDANRGGAAPLDEQGGYWSPRQFESRFIRAALSGVVRRWTGRVDASLGQVRDANFGYGALPLGVSTSGSLAWSAPSGIDIGVSGFWMDNLAGFQMHQVRMELRRYF